jgi:hypothetical protein
MNAWSQPKPFNEVCSGAGGRRRYNALRRDLKLFRRRDVLDLVFTRVQISCLTTFATLKTLGITQL